MDELNGRMLASQIMIAALVARVANESRDPLRFISDYRDEVRAVIAGINIGGHSDPVRVRQVAQGAADELFSLMKPPTPDEPPPDSSL